MKELRSRLLRNDLENQVAEIEGRFEAMGFRVLKSGSYFMCNPPCTENDADYFLYNPELELQIANIAGRSNYDGPLVYAIETLVSGESPCEMSHDHGCQNLSCECHFVTEEMQRIYRIVSRYVSALTNEGFKITSKLGSYTEHRQFDNDLNRSILCFRRKRLNAIIVFSSETFRRYQYATEAATGQNLIKKEDRVRVFSEIVGGTGPLEKILFGGKSHDDWF